MKELRPTAKFAPSCEMEEVREEEVEEASRSWRHHVRLRIFNLNPADFLACQSGNAVKFITSVCMNFVGNCYFLKKSKNCQKVIHYQIRICVIKKKKRNKEERSQMNKWKKKHLALPILSLRRFKEPCGHRFTLIFIRIYLILENNSIVWWQCITHDASASLDTWCQCTYHSTPLYHYSLDTWCLCIIWCKYVMYSKNWFFFF